MHGIVGDAAVGAPTANSSSITSKTSTSAPSLHRTSASNPRRNVVANPLTSLTSTCEKSNASSFGSPCLRPSGSSNSAFTLFSPSRKWNSSGTRLVCALFVSWWIIHDQQVFGLPDSPELTTIQDLAGRGTKKFGDDCLEDRECGFDGSYCEPKKKKCACMEEFEATNHIDKCGHSVNVNETCFFHEQCEARVSQTECRDGRCICIFEKIPVTQADGAIVCVAEHKEPPSLQYIDPAMIGVLVGMALMFVIICVVLRLFSKARWRDNRTIFNTPNARLMNVSLLREHKPQERRGSRASVRVPSRQPSMASLRAHSPNASQGSRTGSRRGSRGSSGNASAVSTKSNKSPPKDTNGPTDTGFESVTVEIFEPKP